LPPPPQELLESPHREIDQRQRFTVRKIFHGNHRRNNAIHVEASLSVKAALFKVF
jgi:hypothetical protein